MANIADDITTAATSDIVMMLDASDNYEIKYGDATNVAELIASAVSSLTAPSASHLTLNTTSDDKQVRINSRNFTQATGDSIGFQATPNQTVNTTGEVYGGQIKPRAAAGIDVASVNGLGVDVELKSGDGNASADLRGFNVYLGATGTGTISGDVVGLRLRHEVAATVSGDSVAIDIDDNEGATDWTHFLKLGAALGTHGMTTNTDKTGNAKSGTIKVKAGNTLYHIQLYANS
jgi:hypothetical protein